MFCMQGEPYKTKSIDNSCAGKRFSMNNELNSDVILLYSCLTEINEF